MNSFDEFVIMGFTVYNKKLYTKVIFKIAYFFFYYKSVWANL